MKKLTLIFLLSILLKASAQVVSPFNKAEVKCDSTSFSFLVSGHFYGSSSTRSNFPASTILAGLDTINNSEASFLICLGDLFPSLDPLVLQNYEKSFLSKFKIPLLNVPGNHDLMSGDYQSLFGPTFSSFKCEGSSFLLLDSELDNGSIKGSQLEMFKEAVSSTSESDPLFIFSHRTLWTEGVPELKDLFADNTRSMIKGNFEDEILPLIRKATEIRPVYWFSGSMGAAPASYFYFEKDNVHYIATAVRDLQRDGILKVKVSDGKVEFETISLTSSETKPLEDYNLEFYSSTVPAEEKFKFRLIPYLAKMTVISPEFWWGIAAATLIFLVVTYLMKRRRGQRK